MATNELLIGFAEASYKLGGLTKESRARFSQQIAEDVLAQHGAFAHLFALERLQGRQSEELQKLWRDVLSHLDELTGEEK
jgi:hypothetical protein